MITETDSRLWIEANRNLTVLLTFTAPTQSKSGRLMYLIDSGIALYPS